MTICIAGKQSLAVNCLRLLISRFPEFDYCIVSTRGDVGHTTWQPSLIFEAQKLGVPNVDLEDVYSINDLIFFSFQFDRIVNPSLFSSKRLFNIHYSLLPNYKGMYPSVHPIINGETETGVTLHKIDYGIDTGDIIDQKSVGIDIMDTSQDLYIKLSEAGVSLFEKNLEALLKDSFIARPQSNLAGSYYSYKSLDFSDLKIDYNKTAIEIHNQFRALSFRQYQLPKFSGFKIFKTAITDRRSNKKPGLVLNEDSYKFTLSSIDYNLELYKDYFEEICAASCSGALSKVKKYLETVEDINLRNDKGWNPLIMAVYHGHVEVANYLISVGADTQCTNYKGTTLPMYALSYFKKSKDTSMLEFLSRYSFNLDQQDESGKMIVDYCSQQERTLLSSIFQNNKPN